MQTKDFIHWLDTFLKTNPQQELSTEQFSTVYLQLSLLPAAENNSESKDTVFFLDQIHRIAGGQILGSHYDDMLPTNDAKDYERGSPAGATSDLRGYTSWIKVIHSAEKAKAEKAAFKSATASGLPTQRVLQAKPLTFKKRTI